MREELSAVQQEFGVVSRQEYLKPSQRSPRTEAELYEKASEAFGITVESIDREVMNEIPIHGDVKKGHRYLHGIGVAQDYTEAAKCFAKAAANGNPEGMYNLAMLHEKGQGVKRDYATSLYLLEKDYKTAAEWYRKAVENNSLHSAWGCSTRMPLRWSDCWREPYSTQTQLNDTNAILRLATAI